MLGAQVQATSPTCTRGRGSGLALAGQLLARSWRRCGAAPRRCGVAHDGCVVAAVTEEDSTIPHFLCAVVVPFGAPWQSAWRLGPAPRPGDRWVPPQVAACTQPGQAWGANRFFGHHACVHVRGEGRPVWGCFVCVLHSGLALSAAVQVRLEFQGSCDAHKDVSAGKVRVVGQTDGGGYREPLKLVEETSGGAALNETTKLVLVG